MNAIYGRAEQVGLPLSSVKDLVLLWHWLTACN